MGSTAAAGAAIFAGPALAACSSFTPASGDTVTCSGASTQGVIADTSSNVFLALLAGGSIIPAANGALDPTHANFAIDLGTGAQITLGAGTTTGNVALNSAAVVIGDGSTVTVDGLVTGGWQGGIVGNTFLFPTDSPPFARGFANSTITVNQNGEVDATGAFNNSAAIGGARGGNTYFIYGFLHSTGANDGIEVGVGDHVTVGSTGKIITQSASTTGDIVSGALGSSNVTVTTAAGSLLETHSGSGAAINVGAGSNITVGGTIHAYGTNPANPAAQGGSGVRVGDNSTVWLQSTGSFIGDGTFAQGISTGANSTITVDGTILLDNTSGVGVGAGKNSTVHVNADVTTQGRGLAVDVGDTVNVATSATVTGQGAGGGNATIAGFVNTAVGDQPLIIDIAGRVQHTGTGSGAGIHLEGENNSASPVSLVTNITIEQGGSLYSQGGNAYNELDGAGGYPDVSANITIAGDVETGVVGGTALALNDGVDTVTFLPTYTLVGKIDGGSDPGGAPETDTLAFDGAAATSGTFNFTTNAVTNFEAGHKTGAGTWTLLGAAGSGINGLFSVDAGRLNVNGSLAAASMAVASGATLAGTGSIGGAVSIASGAKLLGVAGQTLTTGALTLNPTSNLFLSLGAPSNTALFSVNGGLTLDGTANVSDAGGFGAGVYRVFDYTGVLTDNGLSIGTLPFGHSAGDVTVQTALAGQVNLVVAASSGSFAEFWNGSTTAATGTINGGNGTWTASSGVTNWVDATGTQSGPWLGGMAIFEGAAGTATIDTGAGAVTAEGLQFAVDGYSVSGGALGLTGAGSTDIRVGDGTLSGTSFTATIASAISGASGLRKTDLGKLVLTGTNTYSGATEVAGGTLVVNGSIASGATVDSGATLAGSGSIIGSVNIAGGGNLLGVAGQTLTTGALTLNPTSNLLLSLGAPSNTALFSVNGGLTLDGTANVSDLGGFGAGVYRLFDYTGVLTDNGLSIGTLPFDYNAGDASVQTAVAHEVNLVLAPAGSHTEFWNGGRTTGTGIIAGGTGTWTASAAMTNWTDANGSRAGNWLGGDAIFEAAPGNVTIDAGASAVSTQGLQFAVGGYTVRGDALGLTGAGTTDIRVGDGTGAGAGYIATIASALGGGSGLRKTDLGKLILTGTNTYSGATEVAGGTLEIDGSIANSDVTVDAGATLMGIGTLGSVTPGTTLIAAGATHAPGHSIGTQTILGDYVNHGTLQIEVTPGAADELIVSGNVDLTGAALQVAELTPAGFAPSQAYTIIDNAGPNPVTGSFASVTNTLAFLTPTVSYTGGDGNNVVLTLARNTVDFAALGQTPNEIAAATGAQSLGSGALVDAMLGLTVATAPAAFDAISGEIYASAKDALITADGTVREAALDRALLGQRDPAGRHIWAQGIGQGTSIAGDGNAASLGLSSGGIYFGGDAALTDHLVLGLLAGTGETDFSVPARSSNGSSRDTTAGLYGAATYDAWRLRFGASYTHHDVSITRSPAFGAFTDGLSGQYAAATTQLFGEIGREFEFGTATLEPFAGLAFTHLTTDGLTESGGLAALTVQPGGLDGTLATLGVHASQRWMVGRTVIKAEGTVAWRHTMAGPPTSTNQFAGGSPFTVAGPSIAGDALQLKAGLSADISPTANFGLNYTGQYSGGTVSHAMSASFSLKF